MLRMSLEPYHLSPVGQRVLSINAFTQFSLLDDDQFGYHRCVGRVTLLGCPFAQRDDFGPRVNDPDDRNQTSCYMNRLQNVLALP